MCLIYSSLLKFQSKNPFQGHALYQQYFQTRILLVTSIRNFFIIKTRKRRYQFSVLDCEDLYFVKCHSGSNSKGIRDDIMNYQEFLVDNIFVVLEGSNGQ